MGDDPRTTIANGVPNRQHDNDGTSSIRLVTERWLTFEVTAYTAGYESTGKSPGDPAYGITASGEPVKAGVTIACPPSIAFGTRLDIEDVGVRTCTDRGGAITEGRLDVYMPDLADAQAFGRRHGVNARIISEGKR
jgi:3D (Asp-Asp-Asp) domain-containing protein